MGDSTLQQRMDDARRRWARTHTLASINPTTQAQQDESAAWDAYLDTLPCVGCSSPPNLNKILT